MTPEELSKETLEQRFWQLKDQIVINLNSDEPTLIGRTGVRVAHHIEGEEVWEMILNKNGQWPGIGSKPGDEPSLEEILECFAGLRDPEFISLRRKARTLQEFNNTKTYLERNRLSLLFGIVDSMEIAYKELSR